MQHKVWAFREAGSRAHGKQRVPLAKEHFQGMKMSQCQAVGKSGGFLRGPSAAGQQSHDQRPRHKRCRLAACWEEDCLDSHHAQQRRDRTQAESHFKCKLAASHTGYESEPMHTWPAHDQKPPRNIAQAIRGNCNTKCGRSGKQARARTGSKGFHLPENIFKA